LPGVIFNGLGVKGQQREGWVRANFFDQDWVIFWLIGLVQSSLGQENLFNFYPVGSKKISWVWSKNNWIRVWPGSYLLRVRNMLRWDHCTLLLGYGNPYIKRFTSCLFEFHICNELNSFIFSFQILTKRYTKNPSVSNNHEKDQ